MAVENGRVDPEVVGRRIAEARDAHGWSGRELAERIGASHRSVQRWEAGALPRTGTLLRLAEILEVPAMYLVELPEVADLRAEVRALADKLDEVLAAVRRS